MTSSDPLRPLRGDVVACRACGDERAHARTLDLSACCGRRVRVVARRPGPRRGSARRFNLLRARRVFAPTEEGA